MAPKYNILFATRWGADEESARTTTGGLVRKLCCCCSTTSLVIIAPELTLVVLKAVIWGGMLAERHAQASKKYGRSSCSCS